MPSISGRVNDIITTANFSLSQDNIKTALRFSHIGIFALDSELKYLFYIPLLSSLHDYNC